MRSFIRLFLLLATLFAAAPAAGQLDGSYTAVQVDGNPLPYAPSEDEDMTVYSLTFVFQADGRFTAGITASVEDGPAEGEDAAGTYTVDGDVLLLTQDGDNGEVMFRWRQDDGGGLILIDRDGHVWTLTRQ